MTSGRNSLLFAALGAAVVAIGFGPAAVAAPAADSADVYVLHGLPGVTADILVDGEVVEPDAEAQTIVGPLDLAPGEHTVTLHPTDGGADLSARVPVEAGTSIDVVAHHTADPTAPPTITVYPNDLTAVAPGKSRLVVAHTASVPPSDIRVNGDVLFSNVANGEALTLLVPAATYSVDIVPTGTSGPAVFGPVDLPVAAGELTRVFALGDPAQDTMNVAVQTIGLPVEGASAPDMVNTGSGGQAAARAQAAADRGYATASAPAEPKSPWVPALGLLSLLALGGVALSVAGRRRHG